MHIKTCETNLFMYTYLGTCRCNMPEFFQPSGLDNLSTWPCAYVSDAWCPQQWQWAPRTWTDQCPQGSPARPVFYSFTMNLSVTCQPLLAVLLHQAKDPQLPHGSDMSCLPLGLRLDGATADSWSRKTLMNIPSFNPEHFLQFLSKQSENWDGLTLTHPSNIFLCFTRYEIQREKHLISWVTQNKRIKWSN